MNKKQSILIGITLVFLFTGIALATSTNLSASSSDVVIYAFDQNPAGNDKGKPPDGGTVVGIMVGLGNNLNLR